MRVLATVLCLLTPAWALAATIEVPSPGIETIQDGIDAAADGDLVLVAAGVYTGAGNKDLVFDGKTITLRGAGGPATTIDCEADGGAFYLSSSGYPAIENFTVTRSGTSAVNGPSPAQAILRACIFHHNDGEAVVACPNVDVESCVIEDNQGVGVLVGSSRVVDSIIRGNRGGGVFVTYGGVGAAEVVDTEITGNVAQFGGGISAESREEPAVFRRCTVVGNAAQFGGGLYVWDGSAVLLENTILRFNCAEVDGNDAYMPDTDDLASLTLSCCAVDPDQVVLGSDGHDLQYAGPQVLDDPLLCAPADCADAPSNTGRYQLQAGSPCLEENSPCGERIGAYDDDCDPATVALVPGGVEVSVAPNPVRGGCTFLLSSDDAARAGVDLSERARAAATIELFASDGRLVRTLTGRGGEWRWDGNDAFGVAARAGVYYAKVGSATSRLVVVR